MNIVGKLLSSFYPLAVSRWFYFLVLLAIVFLSILKYDEWLVAVLILVQVFSVVYRMEPNLIKKISLHYLLCISYIAFADRFEVDILEIVLNLMALGILVYWWRWIWKTLNKRLGLDIPLFALDPFPKLIGNIPVAMFLFKSHIEEAAKVAPQTTSPDEGRDVVED